MDVHLKGYDLLLPVEVHDIGQDVPLSLILFLKLYVIETDLVRICIYLSKICSVYLDIIAVFRLKIRQYKSPDSTVTEPDYCHPLVGLDPGI